MCALFTSVEVDMFYCFRKRKGRWMIEQRKRKQSVRTRLAAWLRTSSVGATRDDTRTVTRQSRNTVTWPPLT